jgi:riboflavin kinase
LGNIKLNGKVFSGQGEGKKLIELPWVSRQIKEKLGFTPYHGTLNLRLSEESVKHRRTLEKAAVMRVCPAEGYCTGLLFKAFIAGLECGVVIPEVENYPENVLEVVASVCLREKLQLRDGDEVTVTVSV